MNRIILFIVWVIFFFCVLSVGYDLVNKPSTVGNITGAITLVTYVLISIKTKCFTSINLINKKKDESNEK